jgi:hypothetical protein
VSEAPPALDPEQVKACVAAAHGDLDVVRELLADDTRAVVELLETAEVAP